MVFLHYMDDFYDTLMIVFFSSIWMTDDMSLLHYMDDMSLLHYMDDLVRMTLVLWMNAYGVYRNEVKACKDCRRNTWERLESGKQGRCDWVNGYGGNGNQGRCIWEM